MTSRKRNICLICLKRFGNAEEDHRYQARVLSPSSGLVGTVRISEKDELNLHRDLYTRFLYFVNRYMKLTVGTERFISGAEERKRGGGEDGPVQAFCESCQEVVSYVCDLYAELNAVKVHLLSKLSSLGEVMVKGKKSVSDKLARGLFKSLVTQLNVQSVTSIWSIRKHIVLKCKLKCNGSSPKILVHKGLFPEHWFFTYSATKKSLMVLIVIFALASSAVYAKKRVEAEPREQGRSRSKKSVTVLGTNNNFNHHDGSVEGERSENYAGTGDGNDYGDNDDGPPDTCGNDSDSDWSRGAASPTSMGSAAGSDQDFDPTSGSNKNYLPTRRWNLRRTRKRVMKMGAANEEGKEEGDDLKTDKEFIEKKRRTKFVGIDDRPRTLACTKCNKTFVDSRGLSKHLQYIHSSSIDYSCPHCGLKFKKLQQMRLHKTKMHKYKRAGRQFFARGRAPVESKCKDCGELFPTQMAMLAHKRQAHKIYWSKHECPVCFKTVVSEGRFQKHLRAHEGNAAKEVNVLYCEVCGKHFYKESSLSDHIVKVHDGSFPCSLCDAKYPSSKYLRTHLETHETDDKSFFCTFCFRGFTTQQYYDIHRKIAHRDKRKVFCEKEQCTEEFESIEELNKHLMVHVAEALAKKQQERETTIPKNNEPKLEGSNESTDSAVTGKENLTANESKASGEEISTLADSGTDVPVSKNLELCEASEAVEEDGTTIFKCSQCGWGFLKKYNLTLHELVHTPHSKERTGYDCPKCGKNVRYIDTLVAHYNRIHGAKLKPYKCEECNSSFSSPLWFKTHLKLHEERRSGKKFICSVCNVECLDSVSLATHKRGHKTGGNASDTDTDGIKIKRRRQYVDDMDPSSPPPGGRPMRKKPGRPRIRPRTKEQLQREKTTAANNNKWLNVPCEICSQTFDTAYALRKHLENTHENDSKSAHCFFCYLNFTVKQTRDLHVRAMHKEKTEKFECDDGNCEETFKTAVELNEHLKSHLEGQEKQQEQEELEPILDEQTGTIIETLPSAEPIISTSKRVISYCRLCEWGFLNKDLMELHQLVHTKRVDEGYPCPDCSDFYTFMGQLQNHYNRHHGSRIKPYKCLECNATFFSEASQKLHIRRHILRREQQLKDPDAKFICIDCGHDCIDAKLLAKHRKKHDPANHVKCPEPDCDLTFDEKKSLTVHLKRVHNKGEKYPCPICGVTFIFQHYIRQHMMTHQEGAYECETCGRKFKRIHTLRQHELTHDKDRIATHICFECGMAYKSDSGLKFHMDSVHTPDSEKKFPCPHCPKRYHRKMLLEMHMKSCMRSQGIRRESEEIVVQEKRIQGQGGIQSTRKQPPRQRKRPKKFEEEEEEGTASSEDDQYKANVSEEKPDVEEEKPPVSSSMSSSAISAMISNLIGIPDSAYSSPGLNIGKRISTRRKSGGGGKHEATPSTSSSTQSTIDHMLFQSMTQQQQNEASVVGGGGNNHTQHQYVHNNPMHPSPFANPFQQSLQYDMPNLLRPGFNLLSSINNSNNSNSHSSSSPVSQHHQQYNIGGHNNGMSQEQLQQQQQNMYSPNHVYSPPPEQPQNFAFRK